MTTILQKHKKEKKAIELSKRKPVTVSLVTVKNSLQFTQINEFTCVAC